MKNIIITGATGMIGRATVAEALAQGRHVAAIVRKDSPNINKLLPLAHSQNLSIVECGIQDYSRLNLTMKYDAFLHLAWQGTDVTLRNDAYTQIDNLKYTVDAVHAAHRHGCHVFVGAGSQAEYGPIEDALRGDTPCDPQSGYGITKYAVGKMAHLVSSQLGLRSCHTRVLSTYGEDMRDNSILVYLIRTLLAGERPVLTKCEQIWDFIYVRDVARALLAVAEKGGDGKIYPLGTGIAKPLREYVETIRDMIDPALELGFGERDYYPHQVMYLQADIRELEQDTGFRPAVSFEEGIQKTIDWVRSEK
ncbi:MAG: NAD(P)-dependent oxidoreductase [Lachnospiraceae bacterium]|jgi:nucleoside-diphosphate-sugar epimerase|nr:NAD(P)-dependent oxidoreductase [Lachnospiraceae bacterium]